MGQIEDIANSQPGVESAYVIQAGREVRVILEAERTTDKDAAEVANTVARELETEMHFPGTIKVVTSIHIFFFFMYFRFSKTGSNLPPHISR